MLFGLCRWIHPASGQRCVLSLVVNGILPVNAHAEANILNLNYMNRLIFYSSSTRLSNDVQVHVATFVSKLYILII